MITNLKITKEFINRAIKDAMPEKNKKLKFNKLIKINLNDKNLKISTHAFHRFIERFLLNKNKRKITKDKLKKYIINYDGIKAWNINDKHENSYFYKIELKFGELPAMLFFARDNINKLFILKTLYPNINDDNLINKMEKEYEHEKKLEEKIKEINDLENELLDKNPEMIGNSSFDKPKHTKYTLKKKQKPKIKKGMSFNDILNNMEEKLESELKNLDQ